MAFLSLLSLSVFAFVVDGSQSSRHALLNKRGFADKALEKRGNQPNRPVPNAYLNDKTKPYWVDGAGLPEVDFNIGESYSGNLPIDDTGKSLFFWFTPTTNPAASDEITLWLNGGPGCSSSDGFFHEQGPVIWQPGTYRPVPNTWTWTNLTNVVFVDQPVGTGFSQTGKPNATNELDVAAQFLPFWRNFMDLFDLHGRKVYITGESYAGQYCPYITAGMLDQKDETYFNVSGMMIYDPSIQYPVTSQVAAWPFVQWNVNDFPFNDSFVAHLENVTESCGYNEFNQKALQFPPSGHFQDPVGINANTGEPTEECDVFDMVYEAIFEINPCWDIYQVGQLCPLLWDVLGFPYSSFYLPVGFEQPYFNRTDVKKVIHADVDINWEICSSESVFVGEGDQSPPSGHNGGPLMQVIEATNNVIVGHGALDMVLIANGTLITLNNLTWNGKQGFSQPPTNPFYVPYHNDPIMGSIAGAGVFGGWVEERGLTFLAVDLSGHEIPEYQPTAAYRSLEKLLGDESRASTKSARSRHNHMSSSQMYRLEEAIGGQFRTDVAPSEET